MKRSILPLLLLPCAAWAGDPDPKVLNVTGGSMQGNKLVIDFSMGEVAIFTVSATNAKLTQGFLQPVTPSPITAVDHQAKESKVLLYPNPVLEKIFLPNNGEIIRQAIIYGLDGRKAITFENPNSSLEVSDLSAGLYYVELIGNQNQLLSTTKIIKQ